MPEVSAIIALTTFVLVIIAWTTKSIRYGRRARHWERDMAHSDAREAQAWELRIFEYLAERAKNPLPCDACSKQAGEPRFFEGLSWFHCPRCGRHGFASIYGGCCTACSNTDRFGSPQPSMQQVRNAQDARHRG